MNMTINANTRIAAILKQRPEALDVIIALSPRFEKLRNPILRKVMAGRTSIAMASKAGGCSMADFFAKLKPLGFEFNGGEPPAREAKKQIPAFLASLNKAQVTDIDVRPIIAAGEDPLNLIIEKVRTIQAEQVLKIINTFEPVPLMLLLEKQGFESFSDVISDNLTETYFYKKPAVTPTPQTVPSNAGWYEVMEEFKNAKKVIDVRSLEMPLPMLTILAALNKLQTGTALFVYHKRIPVFLLPELAERNFSYRINEVCDGEVEMLIFKN